MENSNLSLGILIFKVIYTVILFSFIFISSFIFFKRNSVKLLDKAIGFFITIMVFPSGLRELITLINNLGGDIFKFYSDKNAILESPSFDTVNAFLPLYAIFKFFFFFLLVAYFVSKFTKSDYKSASSRLEARKRKEILAKNTLTVMAVLYALYMSFAAIISLPVIAEISTEKNISMLQEFKTELKNQSKSDSILKLNYLQIIDNHEEKLSNDSIGKNAAKLIRFDVFRKIVKKGFEDISTSSEIAIQAFEITSVDNITRDLKIEHKNNLIIWYSISKRKWLSEIDNYVNNVLQNDINQAIAIKSNSPSIPIKDKYIFMEVMLDQNTSQYFPPNRKDQSSNVGVFKSMFGWLIDIGSYQIILIIGLVGFGLLGAIVSTFMREKPKLHIANFDKDLVLNDVIGFLIRGFSAAIIVFLAVKGSVGILTVGNDGLNAYTIFFICFASAVYSDKAWEAVKNKLDGSANSNETENFPSKEAVEEEIESEFYEEDDDKVFGLLNVVIQDKEEANLASQEDTIYSKLNNELHELIAEKSK